MQDSLDIVLFIKEKFKGISEYLNERSLRIWCATEAKNHNKIFGRGGATIVHQATGVSLPTIRSGLRELKDKKKSDLGRVRQPGGGRKKVTEKYPDLLNKLDSLVEPFSRGDPAAILNLNGE